MLVPATSAHLLVVPYPEAVHSGVMYNGDDPNKSPPTHVPSLLTEQTFVPGKAYKHKYQKKTVGKEYPFEMCRNISVDQHVSITHVCRRLWRTHHSRSET